MKNYPKPVVAVISSAATGLAASLLSLVDVVYDQVSANILSVLTKVPFLNRILFNLMYFD